MHLSLHSDYACRVLIFLAVAKAEKSSIDEISRSFGVSKNHLIKIVHMLGKKGFVDTTRGRGGGICLARAPQDISMGDVIREMEPHFDVVECLNSETNNCPIIGACGLKPWLAEALEAFFSTLEKVSLADVVKNRKGLGAALKLKT